MGDWGTTGMLFSAKNSLMETAMWHCRGAAFKCMQCLVAHVPPFSWVFQGLPDKKFNSLSWWHKFLVDDALTVKKTNEHQFDFGFAHSHFLGMGRVYSVPLPTLAFCLGFILQKPVITRLKNFGSLSRRSRKSRHTSLWLAFCSVVRFFGTILAHTFLMPKSCVKIWWTVNRFKFNSLLIILNVINDLTSQETSRFPHCCPSLRLKVFLHKVRLPLVLGLIKRTYAIWTLVLWIGNVLHKPFVIFHKS